MNAEVRGFNSNQVRLTGNCFNHGFYFSIGFNSNQVRLTVGGVVDGQHVFVFQFQSGAINSETLYFRSYTENAFQFQSGAINRQPKPWHAANVRSFNSNQVRLTGYFFTAFTMFCICFNSNQVRLTDPAARGCAHAGEGFQFQSGAINSQFFQPNWTKFLSFQFQSGAINRAASWPP